MIFLCWAPSKESYDGGLYEQPHLTREEMRDQERSRWYLDHIVVNMLKYNGDHKRNRLLIFLSFENHCFKLEQADQLKIC